MLRSCTKYVVGGHNFNILFAVSFTISSFVLPLPLFVCGNIDSINTSGSGTKSNDLIYCIYPSRFVGFIA